MNKILVFDMDGTLADFYGVDGWLCDLQSSNPRPYIMAEPLYDMEFIIEVLNFLRLHGYKVVVTSWLAKNSTKEFDDVVRVAKKDWLARYNFPYDEIHLVKYGTTKANCTRKHGGYQILFDDNEKIRKGWNLGDAVDANKDFTNFLIDLAYKEFDVKF